MADDADRAASADEAAMARFEDELRQRRIDESKRPFDATATRLCHGCNDVIEPVRLRLLPATGLCATCSREAERLLAQGGA